MPFRPAAVLAAVLVLSGCSASDSSIDDATAQTLDDAVVAVAERASVDDFAGALTELDALQAALDAALEAGSVTAERASAVQAEIEVVRSDLAAAVPAPAPEATQEEEPVEEAPVEEAPAEEEPAPVETVSEAALPSASTTEIWVVRDGSTGSGMIGGRSSMRRAAASETRLSS